MLTWLPIRLRLTLVFALAMALVLAGVGWLVYAHVASDLKGSLDQQLRSRAQDVSALVRRDGSLASTGGVLVEHGESFAELLAAANGTVLDATDPIGHVSLLSPADLARARTHTVFRDRRSVPGLNEHARMLALPVRRGQQRLVLVVGATKENNAETLQSVLNAFLIGGPLALVLASLAGYALAGAALRPIEAMRRRAADISASSLDDRLPVPSTQDEVSRLGETLNEMLTRIADGLARERRFVADASHELRTPLALLKTELELALRRARSREELEAAIRAAAEDTERLSRIADDLLLLARAEQGRVPLRREPVDVTDVLEAVAERFRPRAELEGRSVSVEAGDPLVVSADRLLLEQALGNLVDNAFHHGAGAVTLSAARRNGSAELHVVDRGKGFPAGFLHRAFEPFSRAQKLDADGSGLGLAIVQTIADAHEGTARAANAERGGADVWITLALDGSARLP
jgi:two-component system OmpR family sensor kinase